jgi:hypothetical protein
MPTIVSKISFAASAKTTLEVNRGSVASSDRLGTRTQGMGRVREGVMDLIGVAGPETPMIMPVPTKAMRARGLGPTGSYAGRNCSI